MRFKSRAFTECTTLSLIHASLEIFIIGYIDYINKNHSGKIVFEKEELSGFSEERDSWPCHILMEKDKDANLESLPIIQRFQELAKSLEKRREKDGWRVDAMENEESGSITLDIAILVPATT